MIHRLDDFLLTFAEDTVTEACCSKIDECDCALQKIVTLC